MDNEGLVTVASFPNSNDTDVLESLFQKEGIKYSITSIIMPGDNVRLLVNSADIDKAIKLIKESGFESYIDIEN